MKVLLADKSPAFRAFMRQVLDVERDLKVVGEAADAEEVVRLTQQLKPDVVLIDIDLPGLDGLEATRRVKAWLPATKVIMLSVVDGEIYRNTAAKHGADGFLPKGAPVSESFLSSGTAARQRLHRKVVNFASQPSRIVRVAMRLFVQNHSPKGLETGAQRKLLSDSPYHHQSDREKQESN